MVVLAALLTLVGVVLIALNARKLISDWPRLTPVHNVDTAWVQIYLGLALLVVAWFIVTDPARTLREQSTQIVVNPEAGSGR